MTRPDLNWRRLIVQSKEFNNTSSVLPIPSYLSVCVPTIVIIISEHFYLQSYMLKCVSNAYSLLQRASKSRWYSLASDQTVKQPPLFLHHHQWQPCLLNRYRSCPPQLCAAPLTVSTPPLRASPPMTWSPSTSRSTPRLHTLLCRGRATEPPAMQPRWTRGRGQRWYRRWRSTPLGSLNLRIKGLAVAVLHAAVHTVHLHEAKQLSDESIKTPFCREHQSLVEESQLENNQTRMGKLLTYS